MKTTIIKQLEDNNNIYNVHDKVRILQNNDNEYIAKIYDITDNKIMVINSDYDNLRIDIDSIKKIRLAEENETFYTHFTF